jgi:hypothetical protein
LPIITPISCGDDEANHIIGESINRKPYQTMPESERAGFLQSLIVGSTLEAVELGASLALIRPKNARFRWRRKGSHIVQEEKLRYEAAARQSSFLDRDLAALEPTPYEFRLSFTDENGRHHHSCFDWETTAAYWKLSKQYGEQRALGHLNQMYNEVYPEKGMVLALGTMARRPRQWLLLGVIRLGEPAEPRLIP